MSLLLDALKKAADDKQKAQVDGSVEPASSYNDLPETPSYSDTELELELDDDAPGREVEQTEELTLDVLETDTVDTVDNSADEGLGDEETAKPEIEPLNEKQAEGKNKSGPTSYTVSDEALSMLIHKTNRDVRSDRRIRIISMLLLSLIVLSSGGFYYYMDMQAEIANLERKHQIAMQSMRSKTSEEKVREESKIIRSLTSESDLDDKVQYAKKHIADEKKSAKAARPKAAAAAGKVNTGTASSVSFQKSNRVDPVAEKLDAAWSAYDDAQYGRAKNLYSEVLNIEAGNRDALLGIGAIAVIEKDYLLARDTYLSLLKQDPRDPIAIAALASFKNNDVTLEKDEQFLLDMLQKNPDAPQLNFALGNIYAKQAKWKSAQQHYFNAWQHDIENADYIFNLAVSMDQLGKQQQALTFYEDSLTKSMNKQVSFSREAVKKRITEISEL
jgi:tetratricopeptide (TPR) repeat protein